MMLKLERKMKRFLFLKRELFWFAPFVFLALCALALARPQRTIPPISEGRAVVDGSGSTVIIPEPFPGVVAGVYRGDFLQETHMIDLIVKAGGPRDRPKRDNLSLMEWIFPRLWQDATLWDMPNNLESILAHDIKAVYFDGSLQKYGFTIFSFYPSVPVIGDDGTVDGFIFERTRNLNRLIDRSEHGEALIARYRQGYEELEKDLQSQPLGVPPVVLRMVSPANEWSRCYGWYFKDDEPRVLLSDDDGAGASYRVYGRESDAERILAMNPDIIVLNVGDYGNFTQDARWRGMDAVRNRRVYENVLFNRYTFDLDNRPLAARWIAEIAYPDLMPPRTRELLLRHYEESYGYTLSDDEMDELLIVNGNRNALGYERFMRQPERE